MHFRKGVMSNLKNQLESVANEHFDSMKDEINEVMQKNIGNPDWYMYSSIETAESNFINLVHNVIDWVEGVGEGSELAWIRPDLLEQKLAVPIGEVYYGSKEPLPCRWVDENNNVHADGDVFQVCYCGEWLSAQSVDWNFTDKLEGDNK